MIENHTDDIRKAGYLTEHYHYFHLRDTAGQERDFHFHEFNKLVILLSGSVVYAVENEIYPLQPHDILLIRHHTIHKAVIDKREPYERIIIYLDEKYCKSVFPEADLNRCFYTADTTGNRLLSLSEQKYSLLSRLLTDYESTSLKSEARNSVMKETYILQLLLLLGEGISEYSEISLSRHGSKMDETLSFISENLGEELSVDFLASRVFLSRSHFIRLFRNATGTTVHSYIRQRRLLNASRQIREGLDASEASRCNGFTDYSSFYRAFRKEFGTTPKNLKK